MKIGEFGPVSAAIIAKKLTNLQAEALFFALEYPEAAGDVVKEFRQVNPVRWASALSEAKALRERMVDR